jgi:uncharacterized protein (DUF433 family)
MAHFSFHHFAGALAGWTEQQVLAGYPTLKAGDVPACLAYASEILHNEKVFPLEPA